MSYFIRLLANLNENTMVNLAFPHLLAFLGLLTCGMMMYLSVLIFRADPKNPKNSQVSDKGLYVNDDDQDWGSAGMNDVQEDSE